MARPVTKEIKVGDEFGKWVVTRERFYCPEKKKSYVTVACKCGETVCDILPCRLFEGKTTQCIKCRARDKTKTQKGDKHGDWTVIGNTEHDEKGKAIWLCECKCTHKQYLASSQLRGDHSFSCAKCAIEKSRTGVDASIWGTIVAAAEVRDIPVEMNWDDAKAILEKQGYRCALTGLPIALPATWKEWKAGGMTASLDRINSNLSYNPLNCQWVFKPLNTCKWDFTQEEFIALCHVVAKTHPEPENASQIIANLVPNLHPTDCTGPCCQPAGSGFSALSSLTSETTDQ